MTETRSYTEGVKAALHIMSGGGCYRPNCGQPAVRFWDGIPQKNLDIAHIHGFDAKGPRFREMPVSKRNAFDNLILLCGTCHKRVDGDEEQYTVDVLKQWKTERESKPLGSLAGLQDLDKAKMEEMLDKAVGEIRHEMTSFAEEFPELARTLRQVIEAPPILDWDAVEMLHLAADKLDLPTYAEIMAGAADRLELPTYAEMMAGAAGELKLPQYAEMISFAAGNLKLSEHASQLDTAAEHMRLAPQIEQATRELTAAVDRLYEGEEGGRISAPAYGSVGHVALTEIPSIYWKALLAGWAGFVICALVIYFQAKGHS